MTVEEFWAQPVTALPPWMIAHRGYIDTLNYYLDPARTMRLVELIGEAGGLTPPEARLWLDADAWAWSRVERTLFLILSNRLEAGCRMPFHLERWTVQKMAPAKSLFEGTEGIGR